MEFQLAPIAYGEANTAAFKNEELYYQAARIANRGILDFGILPKNQRAGISLAANNVKSTIIVKSLHCVSANKTDDSLTLEVWQGEDYSQVVNRIALQYYHKSEMPKAYPELILFPDNTVFVTPSQECRVLVYCEPVNVLFHGSQLVSI